MASSRPPEITIAVARAFDEMVQTFVLRGIVFIDEQACPYAEEFDGNDLAATHLLAKVDDEPAATIRVRWFADFAKLERAAVRREFRRLGLCRRLTDFAAAMAERKGYSRLYGTAQVGVLSHWRRMGFEPINKPSFSFSDHDYVPILRRLVPGPDALGELTPDLVLNRPEGDWDRPGVLDRSTLRSPSQHME